MKRSTREALSRAAHSLRHYARAAIGRSHAERAAMPPRLYLATRRSRDDVSIVDRLRAMITMAILSQLQR